LVGIGVSISVGIGIGVGVGISVSIGVGIGVRISIAVPVVCAPAAQAVSQCIAFTVCGSAEAVITWVFLDFRRTGHQKCKPEGN
jgi:hypothetical protein